MASHIGLEVVAEGVETGEEFAFLDRQGCDLYQGFRFSRPVPASEFGELLRIDRPIGPS
jgi:EAL domain-containing protein (putative c-di-GMP-specific phosphodiesterase class I)